MLGGVVVRGFKLFAFSPWTDMLIASIALLVLLPHMAELPQRALKDCSVLLPHIAELPHRAELPQRAELPDTPA